MENNEITFISVGYSGKTGELCATFGAASGIFAAPQLLPIKITNYAFSQQAFGVTGTFTSNTSASGTIKFTNDSSTRTDCNGTFETTWEGTKK